MLKLVFAILIAALAPAVAGAVSIDLVPIGNPGNSSDFNGGIFGKVANSYQIGKTEITNAQYVEFLNAKAATDSLSLYNPFMGAFVDGGFSDGGIVRTGASGSYSYAVKPAAVGAGVAGADYTYGDKPVNYVSWYDAIRFANWMNNGQGAGSTETGAYTLLGGTPVPSNADSITRNAGATWFLPTENEWYKAAYYNGTTATYSDYPTGSDTTPNNAIPADDLGNSANFLSGAETTTGDPGYPMTTAGGYPLTHSSYGTFDQGGNVGEWNETLASTGKRVRRGGAWNTDVTYLSSAVRESVLAATENSGTGFRLARTLAVGGVPGDYSGNGVVDAADYVIWRDHLGTTFQLTNEVASTTPGTVTAEDYTAWRARFGNTSGAGAGLGSSAVPEPGTFLLCLIAASSIAGTRRDRRVK